jgi:hypothetical protein
MAMHTARWLGVGMALRVVWGVCLAVAAMVTGVGVELSLSGAGPLVSYPLVVAGILALPLASTTIERLTPVEGSSPEQGG